MYGSPRIVAIRLHGALTVNSTNNRPKGRGRDQAEDAEADRSHTRTSMRGVKLHEMLRNSS